MKSFLFYFLCSIILLSTATKSSSQGCNQWIKTAPGDLSNGDMAVDVNENLYISGKNQYYLSKYDGNGNLVWNKMKSGLTANDLVLAANGGIYVTGAGALLSKYDASGIEAFPTVVVANTTPRSICSDNNSNLYIYGDVSGNVVLGANTYTTGFFIAKYNANGQFQWSQNVTGGYSGLAITTDNGYAYVTLSIPSNPIVVTAGSISHTPSMPCSVLIKLNANNGNAVWIKELDTYALLGSVVRDMAVDSKHKIIGVGTIGSGFAYSFVRDTAGLVQSGGLPAGSGNGLHIQIDKNNDNYCMAGYDPFTQANSWISSGNITSNIGVAFGIYYSPGSQHLVGISPSGKVYAAFQSSGLSYVDMNTITNTPGNIVIVKLNQSNRLFPDFTNKSVACGDSALLGPDISGYPPVIQYNFTSTTFNWTPPTGLSSTNIINPKAAPSANTTYSVSTNAACSQTVGVIVTNPTAFTYSVNAMVVSFAITGTGCNSFLWDFGNGNTSSINPNPVVTYASAGTYSACLRCNNQPIPCVKCVNIVVPSSSSGGTGIFEIKNNIGITISPNPFSLETTITFDRPQKDITMRMMDVLGKEIRSINFSGTQVVLEKKGIDEGVYVIYLLNSQQQLIGMKRIIIQ